MKAHIRLVGGVLMLLALGVVLGACGASPTPTPAPTPASTATPLATLRPTPTAAAAPTPKPASTPAPTLTPSPTPQPSPVTAPATPVAQGKQLYTTFCAACHGADAQGTALAPALPGHSEALVKRQVRAPMGKMPAFPASSLRDQDMDKIASFIASLPATEEHAEPVSMEEALVFHHWMAIYALKDGHAEDARHHIGHILEVVTEGEHRHRMEEAGELIEQGEFHGAEHEIEEMLAGQADPHLPMSKLHLRLALAAVELKDAQDAIHHVESFITVASEAAAEVAHEIVEMLKMGELHDVEHEIEELLGTPLVEATPVPTPTPAPTPPPTPGATPTPPPHMHPAQIAYDPTWPGWYLTRTKRTYTSHCAACHDLPSTQRIQAFPSDEALVEFVIGMAEGAHASEEDTAHIVRYLLALRHGTAP